MLPFEATSNAVNKASLNWSYIQTEIFRPRKE